MVAKDDLFQLIKSLSSSEKRYFKIFASRHTNKEEHALSELFDEVDRLDEYDEDKLKKRLSRKKENRSIVKYLSAEKKSLHNLVMRAMRAFHGDKTVDVQLQELMMDELFYHGKSLYELQSKTLYKAKKLAEEYEKFPALVTLLQREAKMLIERKTKDFDEVEKRVHVEEKEVLNKMVNEFEYRKIGHSVFLDGRKGANIRDDKFLKSLDEKVNHPLLNNDESALSFHALKRYYKIFSDFYWLKLNLEKAGEYCKKIVDLYESNEKIRGEYSVDYKIALSNYLSRCHNLKKYHEFEPVIKKIKSIPARSFDEDGEVFQNVYFYEFLFYMNNNRFDDAVKIVPEIERGLKTYATKVNKARELTFFYNIAVLFFLTENWKESLKWINKIMDDKSDSRKDIQNFARVLQLILNYELGKSDILEYLSRSVYRYLQKEKSLHGFERILMNYINKLPFKQNEKELLKSFKELKSEIELLKKTPGERAYLGMDEMVYWLTSKIDKRTIEDVMFKMV